jgi:hypothetical protein
MLSALNDEVVDLIRWGADDPQVKKLIHTECDVFEAATVRVMAKDDLRIQSTSVRSSRATEEQLRARSS